MDHMSNTDKPEVRRIQAIHGESTFVLVIPKDFVERLGIAKGDYVKCTIVNDSLIVKRAEI
jgi:antitoxin component of MazEF toxin-antitoxin module